MKGTMEPSDKLRRCFIETFVLDPDFDVESLQYQGIEAWDSVGHMQLIAALETTFDIMIDTQDVLDMNSFNKAKEIVRKHGVGI
jgi:acyl carrier protein